MVRLLAHQLNVSMAVHMLPSKLALTLFMGSEAPGCSCCVLASSASSSADNAPTLGTLLSQSGIQGVMWSASPRALAALHTRLHGSATSDPPPALKSLTKGKVGLETERAPCRVQGSSALGSSALGSSAWDGLTATMLCFFEEDLPTEPIMLPELVSSMPFSSVLVGSAPLGGSV